MLIFFFLWGQRSSPSSSTRKKERTDCPVSVLQASPTLVNSWPKFCCRQTLSPGTSLNLNFRNETSTACHTQRKHEE